MKTLKWLLAGVAVGVIAIAFRDMEGGSWLRPGRPEPTYAGGSEEPVLGYDGMDQETVLDWIVSANLDGGSLDRILRYEEANLNRSPVLDLVEELLA